MAPKKKRVSPVVGDVKSKVIAFGVLLVLLLAVKLGVVSPEWAKTYLTALIGYIIGNIQGYRTGVMQVKAKKQRRR